MPPSAPGTPPAVASALRHARHVATDAHDQAALLPGFEQHYRQLSRGAFAGEVEFAACGGLLALREHGNRRLLETIRAPAGALTLAVCDGVGGDAGWMGAPVGRDHVLVSPAREPLEYLAPEGAGIVGVSVPSHLADALLGERMRARVAGGIATCSPAGAVRLRAGVDRWLRAGRAMSDASAPRSRDVPADADVPAAGPDSPGGRAACIEAMCDQLLSAVGSALGACAAGVDALPGPAPLRSHQLVRRARALIDEHTEQPLTVGALCDALGVSRRLLQHAFVQTLGVGPLHFLRAERMNRAHRDLKRGRAGADTVADIAMRWGFWHLGRFSVDYRRMFGVAPSHTLAQAGRADFG